MVIMVIEFTYCAKGLEIIIATDSIKIQDIVVNNLPCELTSKSCMTGTDRVAEISNKYEVDYYSNVQV